MIFVCIFVVQSNVNNMKTTKNSNTYVSQLSAIMPRTNGIPAQFAALQASLNRGKGLVK